MDVFSGMATFGNYVNNKEEIPADKTNTKKIRRAKINGDNIYNSNNFGKAKKHVKSTAKKRRQLARHPKQTGVIPNIYNQIESYNKEYGKKLSKKPFIETFSDTASVESFNSCTSRHSLGDDHTKFFKKSNILRDNSYHEHKIGGIHTDNNEPGFYAQFESLQFDNPSTPVSSNNVPAKSGKYASISRTEMERDLALKGEYSKFDKNYSMTYGLMPDNQLSHNNMVPFFKSGIGKGYGPDSIIQQKWDEMKQRKVDRFTGSVKNIEYKPKTERRPLFNPHVGLTHIYGMPNFTDYMAGRYIPSRERRNELIHQPIRTTPGLNLGYNEVSKQGYHDSYRVLPKTVDELRTATNPKISYGKPIIVGKKSDKRGIIPNVANRKPPSYKEQDPRDFVKSTTYYRAPSIYGNYEAPSTNRQMTTRAWYSAAKYNPTLHKPDNLYEQVKTSHKENFKYPAPRNVAGYEQFQNTSNTKPTYYAPTTKRQLTQHTTQYGPLGSTQYDKGGYHAEQSGIIAPTTLRQTTQNTTQYGPLGSAQYDKGGYHAEQSGIIVPTTLKQTTQNTTQYGPLGSAQYNKGGYHAEQSGIIVPTTMKQMTQNTTQYGPLGSTQYNKGGYHAEQSGIIAPTTLKQTTQNTTQYGPLGSAQYNKGGYHAEQSGIIVPTTMKQMTQNTTQYGPLGSTQYNKGGYHAEQSGIIVPTNLKQMTQNTTQYGPLGSAQYNKGGYHAEQSGIIVPTTMKQMTQNTTQYGPIYHHGKEKGGYHAEQAGTIIKPTLRQLTQNKTQYGPVNLQEGSKTRTRSDVKNSLVNVTKDHITVVRDSGAPTTCNYEKIPTYEHTLVEMCEPIQIDREVYANMEGQRPLQCVPTMHTRVANTLPQVSSWRFDTCVTENLKTNPFINNTQHKATEY